MMRQPASISASQLKATPIGLVVVWLKTAGGPNHSPMLDLVPATDTVRPADEPE
jgi:hypothetical protein